MKKSPVVHLFFFAIYPVLFLFSQNITQVSFYEIWMPILIILGFALALLVMTVLIFQNIQKAAMMASLFLVLFFSFGHAVKVINQWGVVSPVFLLFIDCGIIIGSAYFLKKTQRNLHVLTKFLNIIAACLVVVSLFTIGAFGFKTNIFQQYDAGSKVVADNPAQTVNNAGFPDIYYIILDAYARQDVLKKTFDYNNEKFINALAGKGFYVADKSKANYCFTQLSLASSLNYNYMDNFVKHVGRENKSYFPLLEVIWGNRASLFLKQHGYQTHFINTSGAGLERIRGHGFYALERTHIWLANAFHEMVLTSTPIPYIFKNISDNILDEFDFHRKQVLFAFDKIAALSKKKGPKFVFAHIVKPHLPFVFSETGAPIAPHRQNGLWYSVKKGMDRLEYIDLYKKQLGFVNKKVVEMVDTILSNSSRPPIIVLQSDHGPTLAEGSSLADAKLNILFPILNAYYLPNGGSKYLYPAVSPVNTFRIIFKHYFNKDITLLPDENYFALVQQPYKHYHVTEKLRNIQ